MKLRKLRRPSGRPNVIDASILHRLLSCADDAGIGLLSDLPPAALDYLQSLASRSYILLSNKEFAVKSRLSAALKRERDRNRKNVEGGRLEVWTIAARAQNSFPELVFERRQNMSRATYTVLLSRALQALKCPATLHALLVHIAAETARGGSVTVSSAADALGLSYHAIVHHVGRASEAGSNAHLFTARAGHPATLGLSGEGEQLLRDVEERLRRYQTEVS